MLDARGAITFNWYASTDAVASDVRRAHAAVAGMLDSNELIELSIKPSLWYIPLVSARFVLASLTLAAVAALASANNGSQVAAAVAWLMVWAAVARVALASLQWASRMYVLTNRRIVRFSGITSVTVHEVPLARIGHAQLKIPVYHRLLNIGTIRITPSADCFSQMMWDHLAKPVEVYQIVVRAIRRSQHIGP